MDSKINDILEVKQFLVECVRAGLASNKDGVWDSKDVIYFGPAMMALVPAIQGIGDIGSEIKLLPEHIDELVGSIASDLGLPAEGDVAFYVAEGVIILKSVYKVLKRTNVV